MGVGGGGRGGRGEGEGGVYCSSLVLRPCPSVHSASTDIYTHMHTVSGHFTQGYPTAANHFCNGKIVAGTVSLAKTGRCQES